MSNLFVFGPMFLKSANIFRCLLEGEQVFEARGYKTEENRRKERQCRETCSKQGQKENKRQ